VGDVRAAAGFYQEVLGLRPRHLGGREGFLYWDLSREDFVGLFRHGDWPDFPHGWHHVELRMEASTYEEAVRDVKAKGLEQRPGPWGVATPSNNLEQARRDFPGLPVDEPLVPLTLYFNAQDPEGRNLELLYFDGSYSQREVPSLLEVHLAVAPDKLEAIQRYYEGLGTERSQRKSQAANGISFTLPSGQGWTLQPVDKGGGLHSVIVGADEPYIIRVSQALRARERHYEKTERGIAFRDPEGYRWEIWEVR
jgi:catechol 2,3-dioxygenase-like lactoylglutathione lyase family enzyme